MLQTSSEQGLSMPEGCMPLQEESSVEQSQAGIVKALSEKDQQSISKKLFYIRNLISKAVKKSFKKVENTTEIALDVYKLWKDGLPIEIKELFSVQDTQVDALDQSVGVSSGNQSINQVFKNKKVQETLTVCSQKITKFVHGLQKAQELRLRNFKKVYPKKSVKKVKNKKNKVGKVPGEEVMDDPSLDIKKNRPGQRARRLKWEKKYGKDANHLKIEQEKRLLKLIKKDSKKEHPSWDAKRREKEAQAKLLKSDKKAVKIVFQD